LLNEEDQELILKFLLKENPDLINNTLKIWIVFNKYLDNIHIHTNQINERYKEIKNVKFFKIIIKKSFQFDLNLFLPYHNYFYKLYIFL